MPISAGFHARYEAVLAKWPVPHERVDIQSPFGTTSLNVCGLPDGAPVLLLPGGRSTSAGWYATVGALAPAHRVYAVDVPGDAGRSVPGGQPIASPGAIVAWLDGVLDGLGIAVTALVGHSYGAWMAARYAVDHPDRVRKLALIEPSDTLSTTALRFRLRAIPLLLGDHGDRFRRFHRWETNGRPIDPAFLALWAGRFGGPRAGRLVLPRPLTPDELARLTMPVLVFAATRSRQNHASVLAERAGKLPDARVVLVEGATHFSVPQDEPEQINPALAAFLK
jgi:pimeloyl-ACP methyl ester carboxylesterase